MERVSDNLLLDFGDAGAAAAAMVSERPPWQHELLGQNAAQYIIDAAQEIGGTPGTVVIVHGLMPLLTSAQLLALLKQHVAAAVDLSVCASEDGAISFVRDSLIDDTTTYARIRQRAMSSQTLEPIDIAELMVMATRADLAEITAILQKRINNSIMESGVTIISPSQSYIAPTVKIGRDTVIYPNCFIEGNTIIGEGCIVGVGSRIKDMSIGNNVHIENSVLLSSTIGNGTTVGPFAYVRPGSVIGEKARIGDFVEIKNATIGNGTKAAHLTYIGDADVGDNVNFGCGTITGNYDGKNKFRTTIKDNAFIGCNTNLIAPVTVNDGAYIAAGSTITDEVPSHGLAIARAKQVNKEHWAEKREQ